MPPQEGSCSLGLCVARDCGWPSGLREWWETFLWLPPPGVVEDLREAVDFVLGVLVGVLAGCVLIEEAVLGRLEHSGRLVGEGVFRPPGRADRAAASVGPSAVEVADGFVGDFMSRIPLVLLGDVMLPVDVPLLQVRPDVGYPRLAMVYLAAGLWGLSVEEGRQLLLRMPEVMEHVSQCCGWLVPSA